MKRFLALKQVHSSNILRFRDHSEMIVPLSVEGDGIIAEEKDVALFSYGADCALIAFWDSEKIGILHAGWRGLVGGIIEKMKTYFPKDAACHIGPFLHQFEIKKR